MTTSPSILSLSHGINVVSTSCIVDKPNHVCSQKFKALIDGLFDKHLGELGVTAEQFVQACEKGHNQEVNKLMFDQILAVDDFVCE